MKVCYLLTHNPETAGGIETVVKNLAKGDAEAVWAGCGGACAIIKGFFTCLRLRFSGYDVIHAHDNAGYWATRLARNKRLAFTAQGLWKNYFEENPPKTFIGKLKKTVLLRMQERIIKKSHAVVAINSSIREELGKLYGVKHIETIRNGVDTEAFRPDGKEKEFEYIWVSTNPAKACLDESIAYAKGEKMLAVGIERESTGSVKFIRAKREEMPDLYNSAKALIYFSAQKDYSLAMLEAMACGLDVIANEFILMELTDKAKPIGTIKLGGRDEKISLLDGRSGRAIAEGADWSKVRERYKKLHEKLVSGEIDAVI